MSAYINRRSALGVTGGGLAAFMAGATAVGASPRDPMSRLVAEWKQSKKVWRDAEPETEEEHRLWEEAEVIERKILTKRAMTPQGIADQIEYALQEGLCGEQMSGSFQGLDRQMFEGIAETLRGMA